MKNKGIENIGFEPKLRFQAFKNTGGWKKCFLSEIVIQELRPGFKASTVPYSAELPVYLRIKDISEDGSFIPESKVSTQEEVDDVYYLEKGELLLFNIGPRAGKVYKHNQENGEFVISSSFIRIVPNSSNLNADFLFQYTLTEQYDRWLNKSVAGTVTKKITTSEVASLPLLLASSLEEQQEIANCLSSIDNLIAAVERKKEALKTHKEGLLEQKKETDFSALDALIAAVERKKEVLKAHKKGLLQQLFPTMRK